jgi:hypothetical protein
MVTHTYNQNTIKSHVIINPEGLNGGFVDNNQTTRRIAGTYLHGLLQSDNGFDIFGIIGEVPDFSGIYPAKVLGRHNDDNATFFLWVGSDKRPHGLVVLTREEKAMTYAKEMFDKRSTIL